MSEQGKPPTYNHEPLPYIVRLRQVLSDDSVPDSREFRVIAYGLLEATMQALMEANGTPGVDPSGTWRIEAVNADAEAFFKRESDQQLLQRAAVKSWPS